jgi:uncharacterized protein YbaR (Trm112 family)
MKNNILACPICSRLMADTGEELIYCPQCLLTHPRESLVKISKGERSYCPHPHLQDAGGMAYCPDCGDTVY